ncbi:MAG: PadR family transcriptional regulator [Bacteroidota bacterium]
MKSQEYIKGTIKTIVLKLLNEHRMYGYEITQRVKELTDGEISLTYGALYPILYKLEKDGLLTTTLKVVDGRARKYYSLTKSGNETAKEKVAELTRFIELMRTIMEHKPGSSLSAWAI